LLPVQGNRGDGWSPEAVFGLVLLAVGGIVVGVVLPLLDGRSVSAWTWVVLAMVGLAVVIGLLRHLLGRR
jgi:hypothetical protein